MAAATASGGGNDALPGKQQRYQGVQKESAGYRLLASMGWKEGEGLGAQKQGIKVRTAGASGFPHPSPPPASPVPAALSKRPNAGTHPCKEEVRELGRGRCRGG